MTASIDEFKQLAKETIWVDTHCHLYIDAFNEDRAEVWEEARQLGIRGTVQIGIGPDSWQQALSWCEEHPGSLFTVGVHPSEAEVWSDDIAAEMRRLALHPLCCAIGEIGLDQHYPEPSIDRQIEAFTAQLDMASELGKPVVIHEREAFDPLIEILTPYARDGLKGVFHCFGGDETVVRRCLDTDFYFGIGGVLTFRKSEDVRSAVRLIPRERLLLETDSPYLSPAPFRGKRNGPHRLPWIAKVLSEARQESLAEVSRYTTENARRLFGDGLGNADDH